MNLRETLGRVGGFTHDIWRYRRLGAPAPDSNYIVQKLYAYTDGRSNDILFRILESRRKESNPTPAFDGPSIVTQTSALDPSVEDIVHTLKEDGVAVIPPRLNKVTVQNLFELSLSCSLRTKTYAPLPANQVSGTHSTLPM